MALQQQMATSEPTTSKALKTKADDKPTIVNCSRATSSNFAKLRHDDTHSDVTLVVGSKRYFVHKLILTTVSSVFQLMFQGNWKENKENSATLKETAECKKVFETFLDFIYGGNNGMIPLDVNNVVPLLTLADKYEVLGLKDLCSKFMETKVEGNIGRALAWLSFAERTQLGSVVDRCYDVICWNLKKAATYKTWQRITFDQVLVILKREDVVVGTEYDIFIAVDTWFASHYKLLDHDMMTQLLSHIEFRNMTMGELQTAEKSSTADMLEMDDLSVFKSTIATAVGIRVFEQEFCLAVKTRRLYLKNVGIRNEIGLKSSTATHLNSTTLNCTLPFSDNDNSNMRCDFTFTYDQVEESKVFKIVCFRTQRSSNMYGCPTSGCSMSSGQVRSSISGTNSYRIVGFFMIRNKSTGITHHILNCNRIINGIVNLTDGVSIMQFPIPCLDIGQFEGHYLGQFEILYKIAVRHHPIT